MADGTKTEVVENLFEAVYCYNGSYYKVREAGEIHERITSDPSFAEGWFARMESCDMAEEAMEISIHEDSSSSDSLFVDDPQDPDYDESGSNLGEQKDNYLWKRKGVLALIECYKEHQEQMNNPKKKKKSVWSFVADRMKEKGERVTGDMCDRKWRNLKKTYLTVKNNKSLSKKERRTWEYFDLMEEIYCQENHVDPVFTFSTMAPVAKKLRSDSTLNVVETSLNENSPKGRKMETPQNDCQASSIMSENRMWPSSNVMALIRCYKQEQEEMRDPRKKKKNVWTSIAEKMKEKGISVSGDMCDRKWRNLKITYKTVKDNPKRHSWEYFDLLSEVLEDTEQIPSLSLVSNNPSNESVSNSTISTASEEAQARRRNTVATLQKYLETVNEVRCSELKRLRESIEESNKLNKEKNAILKDAQKERNLILKESLREKNDILKELLRVRRDTS